MEHLPSKTDGVKVAIVHQQRGLRTGSKDSFVDIQEREAAIASLDGWVEVSGALLKTGLEPTHASAGGLGAAQLINPIRTININY